MEASIDVIEKAKKRALHWHGDQKYGDKPYSFHLNSVAQIGVDAGLPAQVIAACWLHDVLEDCPVNYSEIKKEFGAEIAEMVYCVTDELGRNRKERKLKTYPKLSKNRDAICIKLCDRIANIESSLANNPGLLSMYKKEHPEFVKWLKKDDLNPAELFLWQWLEGLVSER